MVFSSSPFGCRLTSASTTKFATGIEFDSAKGVGGTGPSKKYYWDINAGYVQFKSAAGQRRMKHTEVLEALEL